MDNTAQIPVKIIEGVKFPNYGEISIGQWEVLIDRALTQARQIWEQARSNDIVNLDSTFLALERSHSVVMNVLGPFAFLVDGGDEQAQELYEKFSWRIAQEHVELLSDPIFASRCQKAFDEMGQSWPEDQQRAARQWLLAMRLTGALLETDEQRERLAKIAARAAELESRFQQLNSKSCDGVLWFTDQELVGVDKQALEQGKGDNEGKFGVRTIREPVDLVLENCQVRDTRRAVFEAFEARGTDRDITGTNTSEVIAEILALRQAKAELLGFANFADLSLAGTMAKSVQAANDLLVNTWNQVEPVASKLLARLEDIARQDGIELEPWDTMFYAKSLDVGQKPTNRATLGQTRKAIFKLAKKLFGLEFEPVDVDGLCPWEGMTAWIVRREGQAIGGMLTDYTARAGKPSGAWMHLLLEGHGLDQGQLPVVANSCNYGEKGDAAELSAADVRTAFHEFGHALHGLLGRTNLPSQCGTNTLHDWVELPSQLLENWAVDEVCADALGLPKGAGGHNGGWADQFMKIRYLQSAVLDMRLHSEGLGGRSIEQFERDVLEEMGANRMITPWHRLAHFSHLFSGDQYAAGYYAYLWAEALEADVFQQAKKEGPMSPQTGRRLEEYIYAKGDTQDPQQLFEALMGRAPDPTELIRRLGVASVERSRPTVKA